MPAAERDSIRIRLLGPIELVADTARLGGAKQRLLLAVLAARAGQVTSVDVLVDILWRDRLPKDPRGSLQVQVSKLRHVLDDARVDASIDHHADGYVLHTGTDTIDVRRFEELVAAGAALVEREPGRAERVLADALAMWRGRPFEGLGEGAWLDGEVARLHDLELRAREARVAAAFANGRHDSVTDELRRLTEQHPLREKLWGQLMLALYRSGLRGEALETYHRVRTILADELGVDPSRPLSDLHDRILRQDQALEEPMGGDATAAMTSAEAAAPNTVAILPFEVIGGARDATLLAVGLHNDLLTELSKVTELTVISRTSVLGYRGTAKPILKISRELNAGTIIEGTLQSAGSRFRLTVQVIDGRSDAHRWVRTYDDELTTNNLFTLQTRLTRDIAASLSTELVPHAVAAPSTDSLEAYRLAAAARLQLDQRTETGFRRAVEYYDQAVQRDARYAQAWIGLAEVLVSKEVYGHGDRHALLPRAEKAIHRALALTPDSAEARTALGILHTAYQDAPSAIAEFERAIRIRPGYAHAHNWHSWVSLLTGRAQPGLASAQRTVELDPRLAEAHAHLALAYAATGQLEESVAVARHAGRLSPYTTADLYEALCLYELGQHDRARQLLEPLSVTRRGELGVPWAGHGPDALLAISLAGMGQLDAARSLARVIDRSHDPFAACLVRLALGDLEEARRAAARVQRLTAWPCLVVHHYHRDLWATQEGSSLHRQLLHVARRSWALDADGATDEGAEGATTADLQRMRPQ